MLKRALSVFVVGCFSWGSGCVPTRLDAEIEAQRQQLAVQQKLLEEQRYSFMALKARFAQNFAEAAANYSAIIDLKLGSSATIASAYVSRGSMLARLRQRDQALSDLQRGVAMDPGNVSNYIDRGLSYLYLREYSLALADFEKAVTLDQSSGLRARAFANFKLRKFEAAVADYSESIKLASGNNIRRTDFLERGAAYGAMGKDDLALADFEMAIKVSPNPIAPYKWRGDHFLYRGEIDGALREYDIAIEKYPEYNEALLSRGITQYQKGEFALAIGDLSRAIELKPTSVFSALWLFLAKARSGRGESIVLPADMIWEPEEDWIGILLDCFDGRASRDAVFRAASDSYPEIDRDQRGKVNFYLGQHALIQGSRDEAIRYFKATLENSIFASFEHSTARAELRRLSQ